MILKESIFKNNKQFQEKVTIHHVQASNSHSEPKKAAKKKRKHEKAKAKK